MDRLHLNQAHYMTLLKTTSIGLALTSVVATAALAEPILGASASAKVDLPRLGAYSSPTEAKFRARLTKHLKPLLATKLPESELKALLDGLKLVRAGEVEAAVLAENDISDPVARKLLVWKRLLRGGPQSAETYANFLKQNPLWPGTRRLRRLFEQALLRDGGSARAIRAHFKSQPPETGPGLAALASAELALGNKPRATEIARKAWCFERIPARMEADFAARFAAQLRASDHKCRLDRLLIANPRSRAIRTSRVNAAKRLLDKLDPNERLKAQARIKVFARRGGLKELQTIVKQTDLVKGDWGLAYQRISRSRRNKDYAHALALLKAVPGEHRAHVNRDSWWSERERHARYWLAKGKAGRAYNLVADVRPESVNPAKAQAFFAGWLALVRLGDAKAARPHFERMVAHADGPLSKSKSEYWLARALEKMGRRSQARVHYTKSANVKDTFHALLAKRKLSPKSRSIELPAAKAPTPADVAAFVNQDTVKALMITYQAGLSRRDVLAFYRALGVGLPTEGQLALLAQLADEVGDGQGEVRTGKTAIARGFDLYEFAYPVHRLPKYEPLRKPVEPALLLAIGRQESEFNTRIVSHAGARGVLQVMPITARHICRQYRIKCRLGDLLTKPAYNTRIASAYIADRRDEFTGSYILTLTGFNAGPGRTRQWLRQMGDPRSRRVEELDWIYRIPFRETRLYVRKVLSNVQIYRARLGQKAPLQLDRDLKRGEQ